MLRKSPCRTPALVAANRANARKSTGPRTARGKQTLVLKRLRGGRRSRDFLKTLSRASLRQQLEFSGIYAALHHAFKAPDERAGAVMAIALRVWRVKLNVEADVPTARFRAEVQEHEGWLPDACKMQFPGDGTTWVTVTVGARSGRGPTGAWGTPNWWDGKRPMHVQVLVQSSEGRIFKPGHESIEPSAVSGHESAGSETPAARSQPSAGSQFPAGQKTIKAGIFSILKTLAGYPRGAEK